MTAAQSPNDDLQRLRRQYDELVLLAGGLAHEIRNPLSTIRMNLSLLGEDIPKDGPPGIRRLLQKIDVIGRECSRLENILNLFLQFSRAGELQREPVDLNAMVSEFIEFYRPQADDHGIEISPHLGSDLPTVSLDAALFRQVLVNLVRNAQDAMPEGGTIEIQTRPEGTRVVLELIDSGEGMDGATCARVFEPFFSRKPGGSGLGLPTARKIVEAHGGSLTCDSEPARGTRMTIALPVAGC